MTARRAAAPPAAHSPTIAQHIAGGLVRAILRGDHAPGTHLPTVRALAAREGVTIPTAQRVLAHVGALGLAVARQGSGTVVVDVARAGDLALFPEWLAALADEPERAAVLLADFLELRRELFSVVARRILERSAKERSAAHAGLVAVQTALAAFEFARRRPVVVERLRRADLQVLRALLALAGPQQAYCAVFNTLERLLERLPLLARAMYAQPADNARAFAAVLNAVAGGASAQEVGALVRGALEGLDRATVRRYRKLLADERGA